MLAEIHFEETKIPGGIVLTKTMHTLVNKFDFDFDNVFLSTSYIALQAAYGGDSWWYFFYVHTWVNDFDFDLDFAMVFLSTAHLVQQAADG
jgi:hypothetical protein